MAKRNLKRHDVWMSVIWYARWDPGTHVGHDMKTKESWKKIIANNSELLFAH